MKLDRLPRLALSSVMVVALALVAGDAPASAPPGRFTTTPTVVTDTVTSLKWQRTPVSTYTQPAGITYCATLGIGGFTSGWRLPTPKELASIVDYRASSPAADTTVFDVPTISLQYWTSQVTAAASDFIAVDFTIGSVIQSNNAALNRVRCVHD